LAVPSDRLRVRIWLAPLPHSRFLVLACLSLAILVLRLPSLFEPAWHTDEGIFAAVAQRMLEGGQLYADAWESKPPLFLYLYVGLFKLFDPGVLPLRLAATTSAIGTHLAIYFVARRLELTHRQGLLAAAVLGVLLGVPFWEGTLALTEVFTVLPTALAVLCVLSWQTRSGSGGGGVGLLLVAGLLFGAAFLFRQTSVLAAAAVGAWLILAGGQWLRAGFLLSTGFAAAVVPVVAAFAVLGEFYWFWDANVAFFLFYVPSGQELPFAARPLIALPVLLTLACLAYYRRLGATPRWGLPALWLVFMLAGAMLTGRPYSHYMLQAFPPLALLAAMIAPWVRLSWRPRAKSAPALALAGSLVLLWLLVVMPMFAGNPFAMRYTRGPAYYVNFTAWMLGLRSERAYNDFFDLRVNQTYALAEVLRGLRAEGQKVYIWGEYPWVYALARVEPATRYTTSFYVLLLPHLDTRLGHTLERERPAFVVVFDDAGPRLGPADEIMTRRYDNSIRALEQLLARDYRPVATTDKAKVYQRSFSRAASHADNDLAEVE
jgi:4-amino-4-deoxy-L-arabinose transferase-like glycosyltransferase